MMMMMHPVKVVLLLVPTPISCLIYLNMESMTFHYYADCYTFKSCRKTNIVVVESCQQLFVIESCCVAIAAMKFLFSKDNQGHFHTY